VRCEPPKEIEINFHHTLATEGVVCYHTSMSTTHNNEETPRTCTVCGGDEITQGMCGDCGCVETGPEPDFDAYSDGMGDFEPATGYETDEERPYGWDVPEEEYPDW
jgi:hypothetical protein